MDLNPFKTKQTFFLNYSVISFLLWILKQRKRNVKEKKNSLEINFQPKHWISDRQLYAYKKIRHFGSASTDPAN